MNRMKITPAPLQGEVTVPPSKSAAHRMLLCAALSNGVSRISPACHSMDIDATIGAVRALGAEVTETDGCFIVRGVTPERIPRTHQTIDCGESGSTLRFLLPVAAALGIHATFIGHGRLPSRPIDELTGLLRQNGADCDSDHLPLTLTGKLRPGQYAISGNISSQYLTGLLLALPLVGDSTVSLTTPLESAGYIDMTLQTMERFGVRVTREGQTYTADGQYRPCDGAIEGDWSQACFFLAAAAGGRPICVRGLCDTSAQGDKAAIGLFGRFGMDISFENGLLCAVGHSLHAAEIDCSQVPDMVPALAVTAALAEGETTLCGAGRLRLKESDRIKATVDGLHAMGITARELPDGLTVTGGRVTGGAIDGAGDHRIVMAFSVLAAAAAGGTTVSDYTAVSKSYPGFFEDYKKLGGIADVVSDR